MNLIELREQTSALIFEKDIENDNFFLQSVNRAIIRARINFPKYGIFTISQYPLKSILESEGKIFSSRDIPEFEFENGRCFSFESFGKGRAIISWFNTDTVKKCYEDIVVIDFDDMSGFRNHKDFIKRLGVFKNGHFKLRFESNYEFKIHNIAIYDRVISSEKQEIPEYCANLTYDLGKLTKEYGSERGVNCIRNVFSGLKKPPILVVNNEEKPFRYRLVENIMYIPKKYEGEIIFEYIKSPNSVGIGSKPSEEIDVPNDIASAICYLVASNLLFEEEPEKANYYLSLYKEIEEQKLQNPTSENIYFESKNNW